MNKKDEIVTVSEPDKKSHLEEYKEKVLKEGDEYSYLRMMEYYGDENRIDLLPFSIYMADKYNYTNAFYDIYENLIMINNDFKSPLTLGSGGDSLFLNVPQHQKEFALYYLKKGSEQDKIDCIHPLIEYYHHSGQLELAEKLEKKYKGLVHERDYKTREERLKLSQ